MIGSDYSAFDWAHQLLRVHLAFGAVERRVPISPTKYGGTGERYASACNLQKPSEIGRIDVLRAEHPEYGCAGLNNVAYGLIVLEAQLRA